MRYQKPKKIGFRGNDIVSLHPEWQVAYQPGMMKKQIALIDSAFFDILLQQKVRQEGLSETHARDWKLPLGFATEVAEY